MMQQFQEILLIIRIIHSLLFNNSGNERKQEEMKDLRLLYLMLLRCIQILKLFLYVFSSLSLSYKQQIQDIGLSSIYSLLIPASQNTLLSTTFCNLVNSPEGCILIKHLINAILIHYKQNPVGIHFSLLLHQLLFMMFVILLLPSVVVISLQEKSYIIKVLLY